MLTYYDRQRRPITADQWRAAFLDPARRNVVASEVWSPRHGIVLRITATWLGIKHEKESLSEAKLYLVECRLRDGRGGRGPCIDDVWCVDEQEALRLVDSLEWKIAEGKV